MDTRHSYTTIDGVRLRWVECGPPDGSMPLVLLHGRCSCQYYGRGSMSDQDIDRLSQMTTPIRDALEFVRLVDDVSLVPFAGCGHYVQHESCRELVHELRKFLDAASVQPARLPARHAAANPVLTSSSVHQGAASGALRSMAR